MIRGEIWTSAGGADYAEKPRPVVIVQHPHFEALKSITICGLTTDPSELPLFRIAVQPTPSNGLEHVSRIMVDKILTLPKIKLRRRIGQLDRSDVLRLDEALRVFLGLAG